MGSDYPESGSKIAVFMSENGRYKNVEWMENQTTEIRFHGIDFSILNEKLNISLDYFKENRRDILSSPCLLYTSRCV